MNEPYYSDDMVTLYHGDCRDVLPNIVPATVGLLLTDPPYGMDYKPLRGSDGSKRWAEGVKGDSAPFDPTPLLVFKRAVLFGANWYADKLPPSGGWLVWDKTPKGVKNGFHASHAELAWTNCCSSVRKFSLQWGGEARNHEPHLHPTQKPVGLMRWIVSQFTKPGDLVLDPYMGSGPVAEACRDTGRRYIGVELEERYCEIAARRLLQDSLFGGVS
jgi:DNA modification methylase